MLRPDLVRRIHAQNPHLQRREVETVVHVIFDEITATLARGDRIELRGFGTFSVKIREAYAGHNPKTGVLLAVSKRAFAHFRVGKEVKERLIRQAD
jgi:integration host factor subunit beta